MVVEASAVAGLLFGEPEASIIAAQLRNANFAVPVLLPFEVASVCLKTLCRHPDQREVLLAAHQLLARMAIVETRVELVMLAERMRLTRLRCELPLARAKLRADLITLDKQLVEAASRVV